MTRDMEKYSQNYINNEHDFENIMVAIRRRKILDILQNYSAKRILEVGCGLDGLFNYYTNYEYFVAMEPTKRFFDKACKDAQGISRITLINDFLENQISILQKQDFDFVICSSLLHEVQNPKEFLKQIHFLAKEDTVIHVNVPNLKSFHLLWAHESGLINQLGEMTETARKLQQNSTFDLISLIKLIQRVSLDEKRNIEILDKGSYFIKPFNHAKMSYCLKEGIINNDLLNGLDGMVKYFPDLGAEIYINYKIL